MTDPRSTDFGGALVRSASISNSQLGALPRSSRRQMGKALNDLTTDLALRVAAERADQTLELLRAQHEAELAVFVERAHSELATLHEHGRGLVADVAIQEIGATGAAADAVARAYPMIAPQVWKIVEAQAAASAIGLMRY